VVGCGLVIAALQFRRQYPAGFLWPISFERWHPRVYAAALLLAIAAAVGRDRAPDQ
jgi:hypothetical protein